MHEQRVNLAPIDKQAVDLKDAARLDLEAHARLEAGLIDSFASDAVSVTQPAPTLAAEKHAFSLWQTIKKLFR